MDDWSHSDRRIGNAIIEDDQERRGWRFRGAHRMVCARSGTSASTPSSWHSAESRVYIRSGHLGSAEARKDRRHILNERHRHVSFFVLAGAKSDSLCAFLDGHRITIVNQRSPHYKNVSLTRFLEEEHR